MTDGSTLGTPLRLARETATQTGRPICLDSSALIAYLTDEPHARHVGPLVEGSGMPLIISTVTLTEAAVRPARISRAEAETVIAAIGQLPTLSIVAVDEAVAVEAGSVRAETRLQLPDAIVIATARLSDAVVVVGNDRRWQRVRLGVPFVCLDDLP